MLRREISLNRRSPRSGLSIRTKTGWFSIIRKSTYSFCTSCLLSYRPFLADFLQRPTPFMYTRNLRLVWALLRAMKSGSSTLALSRLLATVGLRTGRSTGVFPGLQLLSFHEDRERPKVLICGNKFETVRINDHHISKT